MNVFYKKIIRRVATRESILIVAVTSLCIQVWVSYLYKLFKCSIKRKKINQIKWIKILTKVKALVIVFHESYKLNIHINYHIVNDMP